MTDHRSPGSSWLTTTLLTLIAIGTLTTGTWAGWQLYEHREKPTNRIEADVAKFVDGRLDYVATLVKQEGTKGFGHAVVSCPPEVDQAAGETFKCSVSWPNATQKDIRDINWVSVDVWMQTNSGEYWMQIN